MYFGIPASWARLKRVVGQAASADNRARKPIDNPTTPLGSTLYICPTPTTMVLSWERSLAERATAFSLYRSRSDQRATAELVSAPIFCAVDQERDLIEYHCLDVLAEPTGTYCYWLVAQKPEQLHCQGPFVVQLHQVAEFAATEL